MTESDQLRGLLTRSAQRIEVAPAPVGLVLRRAQQRHRRRRAGRMAVIAARTAVVVALPLTVLTLHRDNGEALVSTPVVPQPPFEYPTNGPGTASALAKGHWSTLPAAPIPARNEAGTVWTGTQMLVWGGNGAGPVNSVTLADGASYDPGTRRWAQLPASPMSPRRLPLAVWTGKAMFVWGGLGGSKPDERWALDGGLYRPDTGSWTAVAPAPITGYNAAAAFWTGRQVLVISTLFSQGAHQTTAKSVQLTAYDPASNTWTTLPGPPVPPAHPIVGFHAVWTGTELQLWVEWATYTESTTGSITSTDGIPGLDSFSFDPNTATWVANLLTRASQVGGIDKAIYTGREYIIPFDFTNVGYAYSHPAMRAISVSRISAQTGAIGELPPAPYDADFVWTGGALLAYNASGGCFGCPSQTPDGTAAAWNPLTNKWTPLPKAPFLVESEPAELWTGHSLLVWGVALAGHGPGLSSGLQFG